MTQNPQTILATRDNMLDLPKNVQYLGRDSYDSYSYIQDYSRNQRITETGNKLAQAMNLPPYLICGEMDASQRKYYGHSQQHVPILFYMIQSVKESNNMKSTSVNKTAFIPNDFTFITSPFVHVNPNNNNGWSYNTGGQKISKPEFSSYAFFPIVLDNKEYFVCIEGRLLGKIFNTTFTENGKININGKSFEWNNWQLSYSHPFFNESRNYHSEEKTHNFNYTAKDIEVLSERTGLYGNEVHKYFNACSTQAGISGIPAPSDMSGISKLYAKIGVFCQDLLDIDIEAFSIFRSICSITGKSHDSVKISALFNELFKDVKSAQDIKTIIDKINSDFKKDIKPKYWFNHEQKLLAMLALTDAFKAARKKILKSQTNRAFSKVVEEVESLNLKPEEYPLTYEAITNGEIPIGTFFRRKEQYFVLNDNFELWEKMIAIDKKTVVEIAKDASRRTTYEKDLMSYFDFVINRLPAYLEKHTGYKWTCIPKYVDRPDQLEPPKEDEDGISRKRSALTPEVDNENKIVTVPYVALAMPGRQTTYCYALDYIALEKGYSFRGNVVKNDVEEKLNGRDDYGLMFYTLTGTDIGRGYPTFLIIFERLSDKTRVHFHRTHPSRSKEGDYNPVHNWTRVCYNWMVGNIKKDNIKAQQGDLAFVAIDGKGLEFNQMVDSYDHHKFEEPVAFAPYIKKEKSNILGYFSLPKDTVLTHNEHENVVIPSGIYSLHQCRSWEANPKGVWSLRID